MNKKFENVTFSKELKFGIESGEQASMIEESGKITKQYVHSQQWWWKTRIRNGQLLFSLFSWKWFNSREGSLGNDGVVIDEDIEDSASDEKEELTELYVWYEELLVRHFVISVWRF